MRLDRYLKVPRLVKQCTLAKEVSDQDRITISGDVAKAGSNVEVEDVLTIRSGRKLVAAKVTALNEHASKDNAKGMHKIIEERRLKET